MYNKIVKFDRTVKRDIGQDYDVYEVLRGIDPTKDDHFNKILKIDGKLYKPCSAYRGCIAVEEITINENPGNNIRSEDGVVCPYCGFIDQDTHEFESDNGETECINCRSDIAYKINSVMNTHGECEEVICYSDPVKQNEIIEL